MALLTWGCAGAVQSEVILHCGLSPYQSALYDIVKAALRAERTKAKDEKGPGAVAAARGVKGVNNTVMELRCICNHPMLRSVSLGRGELHVRWAAVVRPWSRWAAASCGAICGDETNTCCLAWAMLPTSVKRH